MAALHPDPAFDRELRRSLAVVNRGAAAVGDVLDVARRVRTGDIGGWEREWQRTADLALARGDELLGGDVLNGCDVLNGGDELNGGDDLDGACRAFLRAAEYYRQAGIFSDGESRRALDMAHVNAFRAAMPLLPVAAEIVEITDAASDGSGSHRLRGYLFRVAAGAGRPLVLAIVGAHSTAEAGYPLVAMPVIERGMNCLILDCCLERPALRPATACWRRALPAAARWIAERPDLEGAPLVLLPGSDPFGDELAGVAEAEPFTAGPTPLELGDVQPCA
jgi:hypothetical protein